MRLLAVKSCTCDDWFCSVRLWVSWSYLKPFSQWSTAPSTSPKCGCQFEPIRLCVELECLVWWRYSCASCAEISRLVEVQSPQNAPISHNWSTHVMIAPHVVYFQNNEIKSHGCGFLILGSMSKRNWSPNKRHFVTRENCLLRFVRFLGRIELPRLLRPHDFKTRKLGSFWFEIHPNHCDIQQPLQNESWKIDCEWRSVCVKQRDSLIT